MSAIVRMAGSSLALVLIVVLSFSNGFLFLCEQFQYNENAREHQISFPPSEILKHYNYFNHYKSRRSRPACPTHSNPRQDAFHQSS